MTLRILVLFSILMGIACVASYRIPDVKLETLEKSFRVSIPDEPGIEIVAFNINRNRKFVGFTPGEFSVRVLEAKNNQWTAEFPRQLSANDIIYVWTNVQHNKKVYRSIHDGISACNADSCNNEIDSNDRNPIVDKEKEQTSTQPPQQKPNEKDCKPTLTVVPYRSICKGELIFEDNFDDTLNSSIWSHEVRAPLDTGDAEFVLYDGQVQLKDGHLSIKPLLWNEYQTEIDVRYGQWDLGTRCTGTHDRNKECRLSTGGQRILPPVVSPRITTRDSFNFKYGRIEIRAKLPQGDWLSPLLLLEPVSEYYGQRGYESGQLRVAFARGNELLELDNRKAIDGRILYGGAVLFLDAERRDEFMVNTRRNVHFGSDYHVYALTWTPENLVLAVDNQVYGQIQGGFSDVSAKDKVLLNAWKRGNYMAPFDRLFHITLGLSVGGFGDYPDNINSGKCAKPWLNKHPKAQFNFWEQQQNWYSTWNSSELLVDYVRVYAL